MARITNEALESVSQKLQAFAEGLDEDEQTVIQVLLAEATPQDDVSGFDFSRFTAPSPSFSFDPVQLNTIISSRFGKSSEDDGHQGFWPLDLASGGKTIGGF